MIMNLVSQTDVLKAYGEGNNPTRIDFLQEVDVPGVIKYDTSTTVAKEDMSLSESFSKMLKEEQVYTNPSPKAPVVVTEPVYGNGVSIPVDTASVEVKTDTAAGASVAPVVDSESRDVSADEATASVEAALDEMLKIASAPRLVLEIPKAPTEAVIEENKTTISEEEDNPYAQTVESRPEPQLRIDTPVIKYEDTAVQETEESDYAPETESESEPQIQLAQNEPAVTADVQQEVKPEEEMPSEEEDTHQEFDNEKQKEEIASEVAAFTQPEVEVKAPRPIANSSMMLMDSSEDYDDFFAHTKKKSKGLRGLFKK